jgi:hypothetical protein
MAGAALALSLATSQAQVYSANMVGYVQTLIPGSSALTLMANPLSQGTNGLTQIMTGLQGSESVLIWNGHGYYNYFYEGFGVGTSLGYLSDWVDASYDGTHLNSTNIPSSQYDSSDNVYWTQVPVLAPGQGFFLSNPNGLETNVFYGAVVSTNNTTLRGNSALTMVGSAIPVFGNLGTNVDLNLTNALAGNESLLVWNGHGYYNYFYEGAGVGTDLGYQSDWIDASYDGTHLNSTNIPSCQYDSSDNVYWTPPPQVKLSQGFFISNPNGNEPWIQYLH